MELKVTLTLVILTIALATSANAVVVTIYSGFTASGGGAPFSNPVSTFYSPDIMFATNAGYNWYPVAGLTDFGARMLFVLYVPTTGSYTFQLNSDDGSQLWLGGSMVVDNGGAHPPQIATGTATLLGGLVSGEVDFFECCGAPSGVDLTLAPGTSYTPEPSTMLMLGTGILGVAGAFRRKLGL